MPAIVPSGIDFPGFFKSPLKPIEDPQVFADLRIDHGVITWLGGEIDIAPETLYANSKSER